MRFYCTVFFVLSLSVWQWIDFLMLDVECISREHPKKNLDLDIFHIRASHCICCKTTVLYSTMKIAVFLFVSQVTANALPVRRTRECWRICQHLMDRQFLRVLILPVVSAQSRDTHFCSLPRTATAHARCTRTGSPQHRYAVLTQWISSFWSVVFGFALIQISTLTIKAFWEQL